MMMVVLSSWTRLFIRLRPPSPTTFTILTLAIGEATFVAVAAAVVAAVVAEVVLAVAVVGGVGCVEVDPGMARVFPHQTTRELFTFPPLPVPQLWAALPASLPIGDWPACGCTRATWPRYGKEGLWLWRCPAWLSSAPTTFDEALLSSVVCAQALLDHLAVTFDAPPAVKLSRATSYLHVCTGGNGTVAAYVVKFRTAAARCVLAGAPLPDVYLGGLLLRNAGFSHEQQVVVKITAASSAHDCSNKVDRIVTLI